MNTTKLNSGNEGPLTSKQIGDVPEVVGRRSVRLAVKLPIRIRGVEAGEQFNENTWTLTVNKHGARVATVHKLAVGDEIEVENAVLNRSAKARVVWVGEDSFPRELTIELCDPQNIWGIKFPPRDWQGAEPVSTNGRGMDKEAVPPSAEPAASPSNSDQSVRNEVPQPIFRPGQSTQSPRQVGKFNESGVRPAVVNTEMAGGSSRIDSQAQGKIEEALNRLEEKERRVQVLEQHLDTMQDSLRTSRAELEGLLAKFQEIRQACQSDVEAVQGGLQGAIEDAIRRGVQELNRKLQKEAEAASEHVTDDLRKRLELEANPAIESFLKQATSCLTALTQDYLTKSRPEFESHHAQSIEKAKEEMRLMAESAAGEFREKLAKMATELSPAGAQNLGRSFEEFTQRATSQLAQSLQEQAGAATRAAEQSLRQSLETMQGQIQKEAAEAVEMARQLFDQHAGRAPEQAEARLLSVRGEIEETLKTAAAEHEKRIQEVSNTTVREFAQQTQAALASAQIELGNAILQLKNNGAEDVLNHLRKCAEEFLESSTKQLQTHADDSLELLTEQLTVSGARLREDIEKQAVQSVQKALDNLAQTAQGTARTYEVRLENALQEFQRKSEQLTASIGQSLDGAEGRIAELTQSALSSLVEKTQVAEKLCEQLKASENTVKEGSGKLTDQAVEEALDKVTQKVQGATRKLDAQVENTLQGFQRKSEQLTASTGQSVDEAERRITALTRAAFASIAAKAQEAERATGQLSTSAKAILEETENHVATITSASMKLLEQETHTLVVQSLTQFHNVLQHSQEGGIRQFEESFQNALEKGKEAIRAKLSKETEKSTELILAQIKTKAEQATQVASEQVLRQVGEGVIALKDWADQAKSRLEARIQPSFEALHKQIDDLSKAALEKHQKQAEALLSNLHNTLERATRLFQPIKTQADSE